jgi:hypothetical protein
MPILYLNKKDKTFIRMYNKIQKKNLILKNKFRYLNYKGKLNKFKRMNKFNQDQDWVFKGHWNFQLIINKTILKYKK